MLESPSWAVTSTLPVTIPVDGVAKPEISASTGGDEASIISCPAYTDKFLSGKLAF